MDKTIIDRLAETLCRQMERVDPQSDTPCTKPWATLDEPRREIYRSCIRAILVEQERIAREQLDSFPVYQVVPI